MEKKKKKIINLKWKIDFHVAVQGFDDVTAHFYAG